MKLSSVIATLLAILSCLLDLGPCLQFVEINSHYACAVVAPRNRCPAGLYRPGWRQSLNVTTCSSGCGTDD